MNTHSPLIPQGALPNVRGKSHIRIAIITILAVHVVLLLALLMAGCKKTSDQQAKNDAPADLTPTFDPNSLPVATNAPPPLPPPMPNNASTLVTPPPTVPTQTTPAPAAPAMTSFDGTEHVVVKGDNFFDLSKKYHVSTTAMKAANPGVDPTKLKIGQKLKIPTVSSTAATPAGFSNSGSIPSSEKLYTVKSGDSLNKIAKLNETTVKALRAANNLKTDQIKVGQKLKIPSKEGTAGATTTAAGGTGATNL
jgi:LysM repeat protein